MSTTRAADRNKAARPSRAKRGEGEQLRAQILQATVELLDETGDADAVSIRAVAERVGKTPPSIYLHFADKDDLLLSVCALSFVALGDRFRESQEGIDDPVERMKACAKAYVHFALEHPEQYRIVFMADNEMPKEEANMEGLRQNVAFAPLYENIVTAFEDGLFTGSDPDTASLVMWAGVHGLASLIIANPSFEWGDIDQLIEASCRQGLHGLLAR